MKILRQLLKGVDLVRTTGNLDIEATGIEYDSKKIKKGSIFVAIKGFERDGTDFIDEAIEKGAVGVVVEGEITKKNKSTKSFLLNKKGEIAASISVEDSRKALASLSANFYNYPSRELDVIGITGTNGKTTVSYLIESILQTAGKKTGVVGTINYRFGGREISASQTTPESLDLQKMFREMVDNKIGYCVLEVSSHSLALNRVYETDFKIGVFTNLTQDHLDFHHTKEDYFSAKEKLFREYNLKKAVINMDDSYGKIIMKNTSAETITVSINGKGDVQARNIEATIKGTKFTAHTPKGEVKIVSSLIGHHNVYNILSAIGVALAFDFSLEEIKKGIRSLHDIPGRSQRVDEGQDFIVLIDYAHTDDALKNTIKTARALTKKRIITVFGCGGNRDKDKRPKMGEISGAYSDYTIITSDNPRNEDPAFITGAIEKGIKKVADNQQYCIVLDRRKAIEKAINIAEKKDIVIIAGKGHERYQISGGHRTHFDDCETAKEFIKKKLNNSAG